MTFVAWDEDDVMRRAFKAHYRAVGEYGDIPGGSVSQIEEHGERCYAVLRNVRGILRVYRIQDDGRLRRLDRWPKSILDHI